MFLHSYIPNAVFLSIGPVTIYWYGLFMTLALLAGLLVSIRIAKLYKIDKEKIFDLFFYTAIAGFIGARLFYVFYNPGYFIHNPLDVFAIWQGGIGIHGGLVGGFLGLFWFAKKHNINLWQLTSIIVPGVALGQSIGRWGNYFNQELFGVPSSLPWAIPIELARRPAGFEAFSFFHPAFLYESIGNLVILAVLIFIYYKIYQKQKKISIKNSILITISYLILYSLLRFLLEFIRIDEVLIVGGMRITQALSLLILLSSIGLFIKLLFYRSTLTNK